MVPRAVLMKSGLVSINTARQNISKTAVLVNTARQVNVAHSKTTVNAARPISYLSKTSHSTIKRPTHKNTTFKNNNINQKGNPQMDLHDQGVIDSGLKAHTEEHVPNLQDIYIAKILKKFRFTEVKTASTPMETQKPLLKDEDGEEVDVHMYRSMIGSLMYLTSSRPDIMFAVSYTDSDYARASLDRKSTTCGYQFLGYKLISWQCKKQTVVVNSITEAEYVAASSCCG
ncbi:hypothetical protein Tco_0675186 [Tanacetum coccineum]